MKRIVSLFVLFLACSFGSHTASSQSSNGTAKDASTSPSSKMTIEGLVRDVACPIQNLEATATDFNLKCALECARNGSPLVILTRSGEMYIPISESMPDTDQRGKLMPFMGKYVRASGTVYQRKGTRAIAIKEIKEVKEVQLKTN
jgi:hypothetical protein